MRAAVPAALHRRTRAAAFWPPRGCAEQARAETRTTPRRAGWEA